jgi:hypothetical protein
MCLRIFLLRLKEVFQDQIDRSPSLLAEDSASDTFYSCDTEGDSGSFLTATESDYTSSDEQSLATMSTEPNFSDWEWDDTLEQGELGESLVPFVADAVKDLFDDVLQNDLPEVEFSEANILDIDLLENNTLENVILDNGVLHNDLLHNDLLDNGVLDNGISQGPLTDDESYPDCKEVSKEDHSRVTGAAKLLIGENLEIDGEWGRELLLFEDFDALIPAEDDSSPEPVVGIDRSIDSDLDGSDKEEGEEGEEGNFRRGDLVYPNFLSFI